MSRVSTSVDIAAILVSICCAIWLKKNIDYEDVTWSLKFLLVIGKIFLFAVFGLGVLAGIIWLGFWINGYSSSLMAVYVALVWLVVLLWTKRLGSRTKVSKE
jgi:hypothetical protein